MTGVRKYLGPVSVAFLVIIYTVGISGMQTSARDWFVGLTPVTLMLSTLLLLLNEKKWTITKGLVALGAVSLGFWVEWLGVTTGMIFGEYGYGSTLGPKFLEIPLVIGLNWLIMLLCTGHLVRAWFDSYFLKVVAGAALMTAVDILIEPVAISQGYWAWAAIQPPIQNYLGWFVVSLVMQAAFHWWFSPSENLLALPLLALQIIFFVISNLILMGGVSILGNVLLVVGTFVFMEFMAWFTHRFVMHGLLWYLHKDHHQKEPGFFEKNDAFFLIFAVPSWLLIMFGMMAGNDFRVWIGAGIALYGFAYFLVHEVFIHQRFKWFKKSDNIYLRAIRKAHKMHHKHLGKEDGECFGMLIVPMKYFREAKKSLQQPARVVHE